MKKLMIVVSLLASLSGAHGAVVPSSHVKEISPYDTHINILVESEMLGSGGQYLYDPEGCGRGDIFRIAYDNASDAKLSVVLAALMAKKKIKLETSGCLYDTPKIVGVVVEK